MPNVKPSQPATAIAATRLPQPAACRAARGIGRKRGGKGMTLPRCGVPDADQRAGAGDDRFRRRRRAARRWQGRAPRRRRRRPSGSPASHSATRSRSSGSRTPIGEAGEVEKALGVVCDHLDRAAALPQRFVRQVSRRLAPDPVPIASTTLSSRNVLRRKQRLYPRNL